ncbi:hypothetical protein B0J12DRAFT_693539 [Macrophomina phaseolina]|uniref:Zinc finger RING/FYVE/PHD-type protein n=1 Tax=Macrophomina phaseolina TaxID=35725 RepID=A0ABQ8GV81_9PEZI|nr:hypothetical protein B0J12DRAFT_693539 [Macrophomina phaseolina]
MDGLGIFFDNSSALGPASSPPSSPTPLSALPNGTSNIRLRSATETSDDSFMERQLSEFEDWKRTVANDITLRDLTLPANRPSPPSHEPFPVFEAVNFSDNTLLKLRARARVLAARAAAYEPPRVSTHPAFCLQKIRLREKRNAVVAEEPTCWRPADPTDRERRQCCEQTDSVCEDCGYVLCEPCGSRCRGADWCVVTGCVRCQTKLGVNICTMHLRKLRANPVEHFWGHLVEPDALRLVQKL